LKERTFVALKPDSVRRKLMGKIIQRYEDRGLEILEMRMLTLTDELAGAYYEEHKGKPFFGELVEFMTSGRIVVFAIEGENAVSIVRAMNGATNPADADPGTIRGDLGLEISENVVHSSDSKESAERELALFFS